jgi:UDPglucose 6-dehydrogenase|tara:strand:+ start:312 stop:1133 length:822 start_codon:yes stop_codon:yes gene_type:complete
MRIAVVGYGFVGKAVEHGFTYKDNKLQLIDPNLGTDVYDVDPDTDASFVCVPTPFGEDGSIDASTVISVVTKLALITKGLIIIKSTVIPSIVKQLSGMFDRVVYNPEFLTERNALHDFVNPPMHIFGGSDQSTDDLHKLYKESSKCKPCPVHKMTAQDASFVKYGVNSFLATKVMWFNQFKELIDGNGSDYDTVISAIGADERINSSHTVVPGEDGRFGFGGACFPKDTNAFSAFGSGTMSILDLVIKENNKIRSQYELDDREKEQKVVYNVS